MNGVTFCKVICEKERGVVTARQTGHRLLLITLSEKTTHIFSPPYIHTLPTMPYKHGYRKPNIRSLHLLLFFVLNEAIDDETNKTLS